ncbi:unnamed protein product [Allacma fusca]|uniref:Rhodanese domain-containing protein n=1 Tax=Allacma fusca TaxID=39272 RepID=A0A8J2P8Q2_9HEXA|nr:unnamed protein product [Allacma fusca]
MLRRARGLVANVWLGFRQMSQGSNVFPVLTFTEARKEIQGKKTVFLDVREKGELSTDGRIAEGKNIPLTEVPIAMLMDDETFLEQYGFEKPANDQNIVIYCKAGIRAELAAKFMSQLGYTNLKIYPGINDWKENGGELK